jgi:hypothetical protein
MLRLLLQLLLPMLLPLLLPEANAAAVAAATADNSAYCSRSCSCLLLPLLMPATDKAVCCYPAAAACLRQPTNAATTTDAPHQMSLWQILLPATDTPRIDSADMLPKLYIGNAAAAKIFSTLT